MTPALTSALGGLAPLSASELTVLAAAAQALAAMPHPAMPGSATAHQPSPATVPCRIVPSSQPLTEMTPTRAHPRHRRRRFAQSLADRAPVDEAEDGLSTSADRLSVVRPSLETGIASSVGPRLAGRGRGWLLDGALDPVDPELFASAAYRRRLGPSVPGLLYAAGCDGLIALAERLGEPLFKIGTTAGRTTAMRMSTLAAARYASLVRDGDGWREEEGYDHWRAVPLPLARQRGRGSPVGPALGAIAYQCPISLPHATLDHAVARALAPAGLDAFAASDAGRAACRAGGLDLVALARHTPGPRGRAPRHPERAREVVLLGPRADADRVAAALEAIIAAHVMGREPA